MKILRVRSGVDLVAMKLNFVRKYATAEITQNLKSWREIPGPSSLPIIGPLFSFFPGGALAGYEGTELSRQIYKLYGPIARIDGTLGKQDAVWVFDADAAAKIYRSEDTFPVRPGFESLAYYRKQYSKYYDPRKPTGLATEHGEKWKEFRSKVNHFMLQPKTVSLYKEALADIADDFMKRIKSTRDENKNITSFDTEMNLWALESIGFVALGTRLNCFSPNLSENSPARTLIQDIHNFFKITAEVDLGASPWRYVSTPNFRKIMKINESLDSITRSFISDAMKNVKSAENVTLAIESEKPILEKLLEIDVQLAVIMASDMLLAGVDTVANTLTALLYLLAKNPEKQSKLREEVLEKGDKRIYLKACLRESIRMMPVVLGNARMTTKDYDLMGYKIPKNVTIVICHQFMANTEKEFPSPDEFIPERWLADKDDQLYHGNAHPFANLPFGFGIRMCIGRRIAQLEMETFVSKVMENFEIDWNGPPPNILSSTLNFITGPFHFRFRDL